MPELPEVETVANQLIQLGMIGHAITDARINWAKTIAGESPDRFRRRIRGCIILRITRRGKYIVIDLSRGLTLLIHLRMTGRLTWVPASTPSRVHEHVVFTVGANHELRFHDTRKFGRIQLTHRPATVLAKLGPEPLAKHFTAKHFQRMPGTTRRQLKPLLLDQSFLAGMGNIHVDEALWRAGIHPQRNSATLSPEEARVLHRAIRYVLTKGLRNMGTSLGRGQTNFYSVGNRPGRNADQLQVFRRTGEACPRCRTTIVRIAVAQRSSHICPCCQQEAI